MGKLALDRQLNDDLRLRLSGSIYTTNSPANNTLFGGDRTGSRYFGALENTSYSSSGTAFSGRFNPAFSDQVTSCMINPLVKFHGLYVSAALAWRMKDRLLRLTNEERFNAPWMFKAQESNEHHLLPIKACAPLAGSPAVVSVLKAVRPASKNRAYSTGSGVNPRGSASRFPAVSSST